MSDYTGTKEFDFKTSIVDSVSDFIMNSKCRIIEQTNCQDDEIFICMPSYLLDFFTRQHNFTNQPFINQVKDCVIFGIKIQIAYENSITVFYNAYNPSQIIKYTKEI